RRRLTALQRMPLLQERPDLAAVAVAKKQDGPQKVRARVCPARLRTVTRDALGNPDIFALVGERKIDERFVCRSGSATTTAAATRRWRVVLAAALTCAPSRRRRLRLLCAE